MRVLSLLVATLVAFLVSGVDVAAAQNATPAGTGGEYPELHIRVTDEALAVKPEVAAGRYLVVLENALTDPAKGASALGDAGADLMRLPTGLTLEQIRKDLAAISAEGMASPQAVPGWIYDARWAGGPIAPFGGTARTIVDLTPGSWVVLPTNLGSAQTAQSLTVTTAESATPAATAEPEAGVAVELRDFSFVGLPEQMDPRARVWALTNVSEQPHMLALSKLPDGTTLEQVLALIAQPPDATPAPGALGFADFTPAPGVGYVSPGVTAWAVLDLEPGTYTAICFVPDQETGMPHVLMGMVAVFTVGEGMGLPAAGTPGA